MAIYNQFKPAMKAVPVYLASKGAAALATKRQYNSGMNHTMVVTHKRQRRGRKMSLKALIKQTEAAKHFTLQDNAALLHNSIYTCVPTQAITQGTTNTTRLGDSVYLCALKVQGHFLAPATAGAYSYRIMVGWTGEELTTANIATTLVSGLGGTELFQPNTFGTWTPIGMINPKAFTVLHDQTIDINSNITAINDLNSFAFTVPLNQNFNYQASGSVQGKTRNLCVIVIGGVALGTSGVTAAGNCIWTADLIFKD